MESERLAIDGGPPAVTAEPLRPPRFGAEERDAILQVLESENLFRFLRPDESRVAGFETRFAELLGVPHCLAVSSGTAALVCGLIGLEIGPGDEVILPGYTYISSAAAVINVRAVPVIAEVDESLTLDPADVERKITPHTRAIMPVHMRGIPARMDALMELARERGLLVIEDVAQACGGSFRGRRLGTFGDAGCFSLQHYKIITTGEGGAVVTSNRTVYGRAAMYHDAGRPYWGGGEGEVIPGVNYRMSELAGAMAGVQVERLDGILTAGRAVKQRILDGIRGAPGIRPHASPDPEGDCGLAVILFLRDGREAVRFAAALRAEGCPCGTVYSGEFPDRHIYAYWDHILGKKGYSERDNPWTHPAYRGHVEYSREMCPRTLEILGRSVAVPLAPGLTEVHADQRAAAIRKVAAAYYGPAASSAGGERAAAA